MSDETQVTEPTTEAEPILETPVDESEDIQEEVTEPQSEPEESDDQPEPEWLDEGLSLEEDDDDNIEIPELRIDDPELRKIWDDQWRGVEKVKRQLTEKEKALSEKEALAVQMEQFNAAMANKDTAVQVLNVLQEHVRKEFGADTSNEDQNDLWSDFEPRKEQTPDPAALLRQIGLEPADIKELIESRKQDKAKAELVTKLKAIFPKVQGAVARAIPGMTVTEDDVIRAVEQFPHLADHPEQAVVLANIPSMKRAIYGGARGNKKQPELPKNAGGRVQGGSDESLTNFIRNTPIAFK